MIYYMIEIILLMTEKQKLASGRFMARGRRWYSPRYCYVIAELLIGSSLKGVDSTEYYVFRNIRIRLKRAGFSQQQDPQLKSQH